jgi:hypothetical protein
MFLLLISFGNEKEIKPRRNDALKLNLPKHSPSWDVT